VEKVVMVSFPLVFIFPHHSNFSHIICFQLYCYSVDCAGCPPSVSQQNKGLPPPSPPTRCMEKVVTVSFPLVFITMSNVFSQHFFQSNCYSVGGWVLLFFIFKPPPSCFPKLTFSYAN
jgi:hypothetical protein